ncbi:MAG TPA: hypothetical protein ENJ56_05835 [Anaerolineae bacterium]|nr:hypothetical protein [Anaerolineae bacterium]
MSQIDRSKRSLIKDGFMFEPFRPKPQHEFPLKQAKLKPKSELLVFERYGQRRALILPEMSYHHICQGELDGKPYLIAF